MPRHENMFVHLLKCHSCRVICVMIPDLWSEMCTARLFLQGSRPLCTQILPGQVVPINHSWRQKTSDNGLPDGEDCIPLHSLVLTQYRSVTDGQTYRLTDRFAVALQHEVIKDTVKWVATTDLFWPTLCQQCRQLRLQILQSRTPSRAPRYSGRQSLAANNRPCAQCTQLISVLVTYNRQIQWCL